MVKKQTKHFVPNKDISGSGYPACNCFACPGFPKLKALPKEVAKTRAGVTCGGCKRTRVFRGLK